ncbi:MAG: hypothetical protein EHM39_01665, partial [Chloroflexi bacterium]
MDRLHEEVWLMKRFVLSLTLAAGMVLLMAALGTAYAQDEHGDEEDEAAVRGAAVFAEFCQACHGPQGEAIGSGPAFVAISFDEDNARDAIEHGHTDLMPPYADVFTREQIDDVMAYLHTWESGEVPPLPEPNIHDEPESVPGYNGDPHEGAVVYAKFCNGCHGAQGEGRGESLFPPFEFSDGTAAFVSAQHDPAFGETAGGPLSDEQIADLETYLASWQAGEGDDDQPRSEGINVLIVLGGALAILAIGGAYLSR